MRRVKVILNEDVYNLGEEGDVREVAPGYARNFLIPQGMAFSYSKQNVADFEQRKEAIEKRKDEKREAAKSFREKIESKVLELELPAGDTGKLFGSVNSATIVEKLAAEGITIERKKIDVPENSIKLVGEYDVRIRLYGDEVAGIKVIVNPVGGKKVTTGDADGRTKPPAAEQTEVAEEEAPAGEAVAAEAPAEEASAEEQTEVAEEEASGGEAPVAESPADDAPVEEPLAEETPADDAVAADGSAEEAPADEAPAAESSDSNEESVDSEEESG